MFDPEKFGEAMGQAIRDAVAPLLKRIDELEARPQVPDYDIAEVMAQVKSLIIIPEPVKGETGERGRDGKDADVDAIVKAVMAQIPQPINGKDGIDGAKGTDGLGLAGAMIDRDGALQITLTNGEVKSLGVVVGKNGADGKDGISFESFDLEYLSETHEVCVKASIAGRTKELRYPAGGIRPAGYWREGTKAVAGEAWVHDGSLWIATKGTPSKPATGDDWIIAARKGRDGERGAKGGDAAPVQPIKLGA